MQSQRDVLLMQLVVSGDEAARDEVVTRLLPRVQRLCRALLKNAVDAKDASQSAFLEVLRSAPTFRGESSLEHWADRIAARTALRWAAVERRTRASSEIDDAPGGVERAQPSVLAKQCLERLTERQQVVLLLRCGFEYSVDEIAELTGVSPNTVKDHLLRARGAVRALLKAG